MKKLLILLSLVMVLGSCNKQGENKSSGEVALKTDDDKIIYTMGVRFGNNSKMLQLTDHELDVLAAGLKDAAKGETLKIDPQEFQAKVPQLIRGRMDNLAKVEKEKGKAFLEKFTKEEGVKTTESGLAYKVLKEGTGATPTEEDTVEVHYHGTLLDGTVFDSSVERDKKITFPLNRVIKGWTEGLQLMKEGGKTKFVIPSDLAYGDTGAMPKIPGGATLVFDVELFKVIKKEEPAAEKK